MLILLCGNMNISFARQRALGSDGNELYLASGDNGTYTVGERFMFYDDQGPEANYSMNFEGWVTFVPAQEGDVVRINFEDFQVSTSHPLKVYNGKEVNDENLLYSLSGATGVIPDGFYSTSEDGALTFYFKSTTPGGNRGWIAKLSSGQPEELYINKVTTSQVESSEIVRGSKHAPIQMIAVEVEGDYNFSTLTLNELEFTSGITTNTSDITGVNLFYTGTSTGFIDDKTFGNATTTAAMKFMSEESITISKPGKYYFWLAYDVSGEAASGNVLGASMTSLKAGESIINSIEEGSLVSRSIKEGFKGVYTIGSSADADYLDFQTAVAAMENAVEGAVRFEVEAGTYPENILVSDIKGTSKEHSIVFTSKSGENNDVIITGLPAAPNGVNGIVTIANTNHVTFENMTFKPTNQNYANIIYISSVSRYFTLRNSILEANIVTSGYSGMNGVKTVALSEEGKNNDYITIEGNTIYGGYIGLYLGGTSTVKYTKERGAVVKGNTLSEQRSKGIYFYDEENTLVENNIIMNSTSTATAYAAIDLGRNRGRFVVRNNRISHSQDSYSYGIWVRSDTYGKSQDEPGLVYNNVINITNAPNSSTYGLYIDGSTQNASFYYNTITISGTAGRVCGILSNYSPENLVIKNNLFQNYTSGTVYHITNQAQLDATDFSNNVYYFEGTAFSNAWGDDLEAWITNSGEVNAIEEQAEFLSTNDLHLMSAGNLQMAVPISFIITDADNNLRHGITPTVGAYEYSNIEITSPELIEGYPKAGTITYSSIEVKTKWNQAGKLYTILKKADEAIPTADELKATTSVDVENGVEKTSSYSDLEETTEYIAYFIYESVFGLWTEVIASETITTEKQIFPLEVILDSDKDSVNPNEAVILTATVNGGLAPYSYSWKNEKNEELSTEPSATIRPTQTATYFFSVKDAQNTISEGRIIVSVKGTQEVATFENLYLAPESYWNGYNDEENSRFFSGSYSFGNYYMADWDYWSGFAYSNSTETSFDMAEFSSHQYRSVVGHGVDNSFNYGVIYSNGASIKPSNMEETILVPGTYITNNAWTYDNIINGDGMTPGAFEQGDYYKVTFKGIHADSSSSTVDYYLADFTSENEEDHYVVTDWQWVDLSSLGEVGEILISFSSSRNNSWGITTAAYACIDNFGATNPIVEPMRYTITLSASEGGNVAGEGEYEEFTVHTVTATADEGYKFVRWTENNVEVSTDADYTFVINSDRELKAVFEEASNIDKVDTNTTIYMVDYTLYLKTSLDNYTLSVYTTKGNIIYRTESAGNLEIQAGNWDKGVYIVEILSNGNKEIKKVIR